MREENRCAQGTQCLDVGGLRSVKQEKPSFSSVTSGRTPITVLPNTPSRSDTVLILLSSVSTSSAPQVPKINPAQRAIKQVKRHIGLDGLCGYAARIYNGDIRRLQTRENAGLIQFLEKIVVERTALLGFFARDGIVDCLVVQNICLLL